ncbi:class I SAM-dependent methyltransferase [Saccharopolyspora sp. NFXS83]|uniref:class I SAM-dependent methyltransferase n=1 Tax=Saccharopolyspora sp. NFXS83 TaxID=2993560 RepID=UPI00224B7E23|nr:class I SAM-dependent methyltransferase [Saccharopolyspora sp. NFXS83]MCX2732716.1 class I SAM-dependent methyltransferase [Saccharopolyspora sp. NFXS83]
MSTPIIDYWNDRARRGYDRQPGQDPARDLWAKRLGPLVADLAGPGARVLDSGCGTGFLARILAADGHLVTGQDASPGMLGVAEERGAAEGLDVRWLLGTADEPPAGPFDVVVTRNVLWTLPDARRAVESWAEVLRPGGLLVVSDGRWNAADAGDSATEQRFGASYADAAPALPMGFDFASCAELVGRAGFVERTDRTGLFDTAPYPSAPGFFLLSARTPRR